ncbi:preprotein translocase subunit YajC [Thermopirellula anaerolimosa]
MMFDPNAFMVFAEAANAPGGDGAGAWLTLLSLWLPLIVIFYFILIRPQRRERQRREAMLAGIKKDDRVLTIGGIYGVVTNVNRDGQEASVTLRVDESNNVKIRVALSAIARVFNAEQATETPSKS